MSVHASQSSVMATLDSQPLPRRVREILKSLLKIASDELERGVTAAIRDFEQQIYRQLEAGAHRGAGSQWQQVQERVGAARSDIVLGFMSALEAEMANLQDP